MKLKYIIPSFIAALALLVGCSDDDNITLLDEVQVSSSYVSIPLEGGSDTITLKAKGDWKLEKVMTTKDSVKWLTISTVEGVAGETEIIFTAPANLDGRTAEVLISCGGKTQHVNIIQGVPTVAEATCADVIAGPDSKKFRVTGICTAISNTVYGNWYLTDNTGTIYIYGTLDAKGAEKNFASLGLEVGDEVTVEGPKTTYGSVIELVNVTVINISKSLIKVDSVQNDTLPVAGGEATVSLTCKGQGVSVEIPEDAKSWLSIASIQSSGITSNVVFQAAANAGGDRNTTITFKTTDGTKTYTSQAKLVQKGAIITATVAEFLAAAVGDTQYRLSGIITNVASTTSGNFDLTDYSGKTYVYKLSDFVSKGMKLGDIVTIVGKRAEYKGTAQMSSGTSESLTSVTETTIADVLTKEDSQSAYYMVTGEITSIANETYANLYLKDGESTIYVYGCMPGYGATGDARKGLIAAKGLKVGDKLTVVAYKTTYKGTPQLAGCSYFSHVSQ